MLLEGEKKDAEKPRSNVTLEEFPAKFSQTKTQTSKQTRNNKTTTKMSSASQQQQQRDMEPHETREHTSSSSLSSLSIAPSASSSSSSKQHQHTAVVVSVVVNSSNGDDGDSSTSEDIVIDAEELQEHIEEYLEAKREEKRKTVASHGRHRKSYMFTSKELIQMFKSFSEWFKGWAIDVFLFRMFDCIIVAFLFYVTKKHRFLQQMLGWLTDWINELAQFV